MAADDSDYPMPPRERLFAPEELRPLEEFPEPLVAHLASRPDLRYHLTAIRKHLLELRDEAQRRLASTLGGVVVGSPDHMEKVEEWRESVNAGNVPAAFGDMRPLHARELLADHFFFGELLGLVQLTLERGLWRALPGAGLVGTGEQGPLSLRRWSQTAPSETATQDLEQVLQLADAASDMGRAIADLLGAIQLVLSLLTNMTPADLIRGRATVVNARAAASSAKYARGIQAATDAVYREGMTEQTCWDALETVNEETFTLEEAGYEFYLDQAGNKTIAACQRDEQTGHERSVGRTSFRPYFIRARDRPRAP